MMFRHTIAAIVLGFGVLTLLSPSEAMAQLDRANGWIIHPPWGGSYPLNDKMDAEAHSEYRIATPTVAIDVRRSLKFERPDGSTAGFEASNPYGTGAAGTSM